MDEIFISYARSTAPQAGQVAAALRGLGYAVWLDDQLPAHRPYAEVIEERLAASAVVIVLWCADAVRSEWVQSEADHGRAARKLVQVRLDASRLPMPFDRIQCADLAGWTGDLQAPGWLQLASGVAALVGGAQPQVPEPTQEPPPLMTGLPSIAVLPFVNMSNDPEQEYFVDGMVEEIVSALSRFRSIFVIGSGSGLALKGQAVTPQEAARRFGVRYVLEGSVRKAGGRVRITLHLIDASDGAQIWTERLEDTLEDIFALQDRIAARVAGVFEPTAEDVDIRRVTARPTDNVTSYDFYLRSLHAFRDFRKEETFESIELLDRAIALDPDFALALSQSAVCLRLVIDNGWTDDPETFRRRGLERVERALRVGGSDAKVLAQAAVALPGLDGRLDRALALIARAAEMNPGSSFVWLISGTLRLRNGEPDVAAEHLETSTRLDPISGNSGLARMYLAAARFQQGRYDDALALYRMTAFRLPVSYAILAALYGHIGQPAAAREALAQFRALSPGSIDDVADIWFHRPEHRERFMTGLALAEAVAS